MWMIQGLGLLRLNVGSNLRLHIWNSDLEYPNVSKHHNHSWDLTSTIVCGELQNQRFIEHREGLPFWKRRLICGVGCKWAGEAVEVLLKPLAVEVYRGGDSYFQKANEVHVTRAIPGTVTMMRRQYDGPKGEADIYWPVGTEWGTAEPRQATVVEIEQTTKLAAKLLTL